MLTPDEKFMRQALNLAKKGLGRTSPNPAVGAVIVRAGRVIAAGYHKQAGGPHAEVEALKAMPGKQLGLKFEISEYRNEGPIRASSPMRTDIPHRLSGV